MISVIPAKAISKRLPGKNLRKLGGKPLIQWTIEASLNTKSIDRTIVTSDSLEILELAVKLGAEIVERPKELTTDKTPTPPVIIHAVKALKVNTDAIITLQPTSPFRTAKQLELACSVFKIIKSEKQEIDTLLGIRAVRDQPLWMFKSGANISINKDQNFIKLDYLLENQMQVWNQSYLDYDKAYYPNGSIYITDFNCLINSKNILGKKIYGYVMDKISSHDIDSEEDWIIAEYYLEKAKA